MACGTGVALHGCRVRCPAPAPGQPGRTTGRPFAGPANTTMAKSNVTAPTTGATVPARKGAAPATALLATPYSMPALPANCPATVAKGTPGTPGTLASALGLGYTVPATHKGALVVLANTVWPSMGPGATVQVASHGAAGLVLHARTTASTQPVCNAIPCAATGGGTKGALRLAVPAAVLGAFVAYAAGGTPGSAQQAALAVWCAQAAPCAVALPGGGG